MAKIMVRVNDARLALLAAAQVYGYGRRTASRGFTDEKFVTAQHNLHAASERYARAFAAWKRWENSWMLSNRRGKGNGGKGR